jgi:DNA processing protein
MDLKVIHMDRRTQQAALLALCRGNHGDPGSLAERVEASGDAYELLMSEQHQAQDDVFEAGPSTEERLRAQLQAMSMCDAEDIRLVTVLDEDYPRQLRTLPHRPPFLFYRGTLAEGDLGGVAVVGGREPSDEATGKTAEIAAGLADHGVPVVAGLAAGIETVAHRTALEASGRTVAVIATGLHCSYPAQNAHLQEEVGRRHLVLSRFWPTAVPAPTSFPLRHALLSGYTAATVVVEAEGKNHARTQAWLALQQGRRVFLLASLLCHDWARKYAELPGVSVVSGVTDILELLPSSIAVR